MRRENYTRPKKHKTLNMYGGCQILQPEKRGRRPGFRIGWNSLPYLNGDSKRRPRRREQQPSEWAKLPRREKRQPPVRSACAHSAILNLANLVHGQVLRLRSVDSI